VVPTHEIFQKPLKVNFRWEERPTPENYRHWPGGEKLGKTIKVWKVQTKKFPAIDRGLVSDPYGFDDSPDAEAIASGLNSKGPKSVTLGRHGNYFLWGFSASPRDMTTDARLCFVNCVCYIKKFDGQPPLVRKTGQSRQWVMFYVNYLNSTTNEKFLDQVFTKEVRQRCGKDAQKYRQYYEENMEYLRYSPSLRKFLVDEDLKTLGLSNRRIEFLDRCVGMLEKDDRPELAQRLLTRYTTETDKDAVSWRAWLESSRPRLFFSDVGGFKWKVAPPTTASVTRVGLSR